MANLVTGRVFWSWILVVLSLSGINEILGQPINSWCIPLGALTFIGLFHLAGDRWRQGAGQRNQVIQEDYEARHAARINGEQVFTEWELRESLDEAGKAAFDLLEDAIHRRDGTSGGESFE